MLAPPRHTVNLITSLIRHFTGCPRREDLEGHLPIVVESEVLKSQELERPAEAVVRLVGAVRAEAGVVV